MEHALGETEIATPRQRVVSLVGQADLQWMLALGVTPVAYGAGDEYPTSYYQDPDALVEVSYLPWEGDIPPLEAIAAAEPDLLTGNRGRLEADYELLSQIAPTVTFDGDDAETVGRPIAAALGREDAFELLLAEQDEAVAAFTEQFGELLEGRTVSTFIGEPAGDYYELFGPSRPHVPLLEELGFDPPPAFEDFELDPERGSVLLSGEQLTALAADVMICLHVGGAQEEFCDDVTSEPLLADLPAVQEGRVLTPTDGFPFYDVASPRARDAFLTFLRHEVVPTLAAEVGRAATVPRPGATEPTAAPRSSPSGAVLGGDDDPSRDA